MARSLAVILVIALVAATMSVVQWRLESRASHRADVNARSAELGQLEAVARTLPADRNSLALLLGVAAHKLQPGLDSEAALETALVHTPPGLDRVIPFSTPTFFPLPSPDGRSLVASGSDGSVRVIDLDTGAVRETLHGTTPGSVAIFTADGQGVISGSNSGGVVTVWDLASGEQDGTQIHAAGSQVYPQLDPTDPTALYTVSDHGEIDHWNRRDPNHPVMDGKPFITAAPSSGSLPFVANVSPDGRLLAAGAADGSTGTRVWDVATHSVTGQFGGAPEGFVNNATLALSTATGLELMDARSGASKGVIPGLSGASAGGPISPDRQLIAVGDDLGTVQVMNLESLVQVGPLLTVPAGVLPTASLPDGRLMISGSTEASIWRIGATVGPLGTTMRADTDPSPDGSSPTAEGSSRKATITRRRNGTLAREFSLHHSRLRTARCSM